MAKVQIPLEAIEKRIRKEILIENLIRTAVGMVAVAAFRRIKSARSDRSGLTAK